MSCISGETDPTYDPNIQLYYYNLTFTSLCNLPEPSLNYGIPTYDLSITTTDQKNYNIKNGNDVGTFNWTCVSGFNSPTSSSGYEISVESRIQMKIKTVSGSGLIKTGVTWTIKWVGSGCSSTLQASVVTNSSSSIIIIPPPDTTSSDGTIIGEINTTKDGKQICQSNLSVRTPFPCCGTFAVVEDYVFYCTPVQDLMKGCGNTIASKVDSLHIEGLTTYDIIKYSMLRLVLTMTLLKTQGINVCWLRQKYYPQFIQTLSKSKFNKFMIYFNGVYKDYYNYFCQ